MLSLISRTILPNRKPSKVSYFRPDQIVRSVQPIPWIPIYRFE